MWDRTRQLVLHAWGRSIVLHWPTSGAGETPQKGSALSWCLPPSPSFEEPYLLLFLPSGNEISRPPISPAYSEQVEGEEPDRFSGLFVRLIQRIFFPRHILGGHLPRISGWGTSRDGRLHPESLLLDVEGAHFSSHDQLVWEVKGEGGLSRTCREHRAPQHVG